MLHVGRAGHPGPGSWYYPSQVNFPLNLLMTFGDLAMDSCAQFLAVAEHRLIPSGVRSVGHLVPACQDQVACGHAGVGVVS